MPNQHLGKQSSIRLDPEQQALWDRLAKTHGGKKEAMVAGLRALEQGAPEPTPEQAVRVLDVMVKKQRPKRSR